MAELKGSYKEDFNKVKKYIEKTAAKSSEREEVSSKRGAMVPESLALMIKSKMFFDFSSANISRALSKASLCER